MAQEETEKKIKEWTDKYGMDGDLIRVMALDESIEHKENMKKDLEVFNDTVYDEGSYGRRQYLSNICRMAGCIW